MTTTKQASSSPGSTRIGGYEIQASSELLRNILLHGRKLCPFRKFVTWLESINYWDKKHYTLVRDSPLKRYPVLVLFLSPPVRKAVSRPSTRPILKTFLHLIGTQKWHGELSVVFGFVIKKFMILPSMSASSCSYLFSGSRFIKTHTSPPTHTHTHTCRERGWDRRWSFTPHSSISLWAAFMHQRIYWLNLTRNNHCPWLIERCLCLIHRLIFSEWLTLSEVQNDSASTQRYT